jgi:histidine decarboxylase
MSKSARKQLDQLASDIKERSQLFIGYPVATDFDYTEIHPLFNYFMNNIGDPTISSLCRLNTNEMEKEVISFYASLVGTPADDTWGYITSGSTEGNLYGLLVARERFPEGTVYHSNASHYSVSKNAHLLRMPVNTIKTQPQGELDYNDLRSHLLKNKMKPAIIVANIGTTMSEARDDIHKIKQALSEVGITEYHIHCDAALVGSYAAFIEPKKPFDFTEGADSMAISAYKFLGIPEPCGIILTRQSLRVSHGGNVSYIGNLDSTISGSRSGHTALMIWYRLQQLGTEGIRTRYKESLDTATYTQLRLEEIGWPTWRNNGAITTMLMAPSEDVVKKWQLAIDNGWCHVICMPGIDKERIDLFIQDLLKEQIA